MSCGLCDDVMKRVASKARVKGTVVPGNEMIPREVVTINPEGTVEASPGYDIEEAIDHQIKLVQIREAVEVEVGRDPGVWMGMSCGIGLPPGDLQELPQEGRIQVLRIGML